jgi:hypothetical protein
MILFFFKETVLTINKKIWEILDQPTSSFIIKLGRLSPPSGGIKEPRRLGGPDPGANDPLRSGSRITSIFGASIIIGVGALISGTLISGFGVSYAWKNRRIRISETMSQNTN